MFAIVLDMEDALELLELAVTGVAMCASSPLSDTDLRSAVIGVQRHIDRLKVLHAGLLHEVDRRGMWNGTGARDVADWLAGVTNTSKGDAASRARLGAALNASDALKQAAENGDVSAATAESLFDAVTDTPGATSADIDGLVDSCKGASPKAAREAGDDWKKTFATETPEAAEARRREKRSVTTKPLGDGMGQLTAILPLLDLRQVTNAISHVAGKPCEADPRTTEQRMADGLVQLAVAYAKGEVKGGREKPTILININAEDYANNTGDGVTAHGDRIPAHVVKRLAEDAMIQRVLMAGGHVLDLGREVRYATEAQYKALMVRDGGCRWAGCHMPAAWCDADHLTAWDDHGHTNLDNLALWCRHHHTEKHRPGVTVLGNANNLRLRLIDGTIIHCPPKTTAATRPRTQAAA
jgi:hypothetical protein